MKYLKFLLSILKLFIIITACCLATFCAIILIISHNEIEARRQIHNQIKTVYSFQHPEIVGTNELGETIKCYHVYGENDGTIYEIDRTKTKLTNHGKFGTTTDVSVEN